MPAPSLAPTAPAPVIVASAPIARSRGLTLVAVRDGLWRVVEPSGSILGHIERSANDDGDSFRARRLSATRTMELGVFWRMDEATDCFR